LLNDPADSVPLRAVMDYYKHRVPKCKQSDSLEIMFEKFRKGASHIAFVYADDDNENTNEKNNNEEVGGKVIDSKEELQHNETSRMLSNKKEHEKEEEEDDEKNRVIGILTLENIIEELVQSEILDEADTKREKRRKRAKGLLKGKLANIGMSNENLNMFVTEVDTTNQPIISTQIRKALFYFLASSVRPFMGEFISPKVLEQFLRQPEFTQEKRNLSEDDTDQNMYLYQYNEPCDYFLIILDGSATVNVGKERMEVTAGLFSFYGVNALLFDNEKDPLGPRDQRPQGGVYRPEFDLKVDSYCVYLKITRQAWLDAVRKSLMERTLVSNGAVNAGTVTNNGNSNGNKVIANRSAPAAAAPIGVAALATSAVPIVVPAPAPSTVTVTPSSPRLAKPPSNNNSGSTATTD